MDVTVGGKTFKVLFQAMDIKTGELVGGETEYPIPSKNFERELRFAAAMGLRPRKPPPKDEATV